MNTTETPTTSGTSNVTTTPPMRWQIDNATLTKRALVRQLNAMLLRGHVTQLETALLAIDLDALQLL
jgi:hypothetical protein